MKIIKGYKFYTLDEVITKKMRESKKFRQGYEEELARLKLVSQIVKLRRIKKLTQKTLAQKAQMPQSAIARIESGTHSCSLGTLYRVANVFGKEIRLV